MSYYHDNHRLDGIPGVVKNDKGKFCVAPIQSLPFIRAEFDGEIYYKTPLWKLLGQERPEKRPVEYLGPEPVVPALALKPYDYQIEGIKFMIDRLNNEGFVLCSDAVGLGKTLMSIGTLKWFVETRGARKILIICKKSIKAQWEEEIRNIADWHKVPIFVTGDTKKKRMSAYEGIKDVQAGILITNYHSFLYDSAEINKTNYDICVIDEVHSIKGKDGKMNNLIGDTVKGKRTILLTGTPIMSRPEDIYGIIRLAAPGFFGEYEDFEKRYIRIYDGRYGRQMIGARHLDELQEKIRRILIMRSAEDVALELPERKMKSVYCEMDATQRKMRSVIEERLDLIEERIEKVRSSSDLTPEERDRKVEELVKKSNVFNATLQFIADDPAVLRYASPKYGSVNHHLKEMLPASYKMSAKTEATLEIVNEIIDAGEKVIIFCHWKTSARMLQDRLRSLDKANVVMYTGEESEEKRNMNVQAFKTDPSVNIIIGTEAMAEGLNLQVCPYLINYEQADTYAVREQRIGRIRRLGSKYKYIYVIDLVTKDEKSKDIAKLRKIKRDEALASAILVSA